jgi:hypothetical protein
MSDQKNKTCLERLGELVKGDRKYLTKADRECLTDLVNEVTLFGQDDQRYDNLRKWLIEQAKHGGLRKFEYNIDVLNKTLDELE